MKVEWEKALLTARMEDSANSFQSSQVMVDICREAIADIGHEEIGVNSGPYVRNLRWFCGFPVEEKGPWCAVFTSAMAKYAREQSPVGFSLSRGAYRFVQNVGKAKCGRFIQTPEPGFAVWKRKGWLLRRSAHIRIVVAYDVFSDTMYCVGGNENNKVKMVILRNGSWRKGLLKMATMEE